MNYELRVTNKRALSSTSRSVSRFARVLLAVLMLAPTYAAAESPYATAVQAGEALEKAGKLAEARAQFEKAQGRASSPHLVPLRFE